MPLYREDLPQLDGELYLTDGGLETTLIFHGGIELRDFAAFELLETPDGMRALREYYRTYAAIAERFGSGLILESATWRASADWGTKLGYTPAALAEVNRRSIEMLEELRDELRGMIDPIVVSGCIGPRGDGYVPAERMSVAEAEEYHRPQIEIFADTAADMICAMTMNYPEEALGIAKAAKIAHLPVAISFTVETDGHLPTMERVRDVIERIDASTAAYPSYYMINCAHPTHFSGVIGEGGPWATRVRGLRANASVRSHAELNEAPDLDIGDPTELGAQYAALRSRLPHLNVMGGCCGTDHRHVESIAHACAPLFKVGM